jgi:hypothetical protein
MRRVKEIVTAMLHDDSGTAGFDWMSIGMAAMLFLVMTRLEGLIYCCTGSGFLQP